MISFLKDKNPGVRRRAAQAFQYIQSREAVLPLIDLLTDQEPTVRKEAVRALGCTKDIRAVTPLIDALKRVAPDDYSTLNDIKNNLRLIVDGPKFGEGSWEEWWNKNKEKYR